MNIKDKGATDHIVDVEIVADREGLIPEYQSSGAAGLDLQSIEPGTLVLAPGEVAKIRTGIRVHPLAKRDVVGLVFPRSGTATKKGLVLANTVGVIDSDYQGEIILAIRNSSDQSQDVAYGERLAQLVFMPILVANFIPVDTFTVTTLRGAGGFGSTGAGRHSQVETERGHIVAAVAALEG